MTETPALAPTHPAPPTNLNLCPDKPPFQPTTIPIKTKQDENGQVQCYCHDPTFDDGYTIQCETCGTWQHGICFYPGTAKEVVESEDFPHKCLKCHPRQLELDKLKLLEDDKKANKKPALKTHKKKVKPIDLQLNGNHVAGENSKHNSPHDHPPAKKAKTSHKSSPSLSSHARKRSPSHDTTKSNHHNHPLSPATTPPDHPLEYDRGHAYEFLARYDEPYDPVDNNSFDVTALQHLIAWSRDKNTFLQDTGAEFDDLVHTTRPFPVSPPLRIEKTLPGPTGTALHWPRLVTPADVDKDVPLMELNGKASLQSTYCGDSSNRYSDLSAPLPFVFFPPGIPLYVDTRESGSEARFVRRSCRENTRLVTYYPDDNDWQFWLVSDRPIAAGDEITLGWDFSLPKSLQARMERLFNFGDEDGVDRSVADLVADMDDADLQMLYNWVNALFHEYGGCACNRNEGCAFSRLIRQYDARIQSRPNPPKRKRAKSKPHTLSPTSTGQATNSRAASEGRLDEVPELDNSSTAGSSRSKPPSRDRTPARLGSFDTLGILTEPTNRDKRKVQIAETLFQKSAQEEQQPPRKKKKVAADGASNTTSKHKRRNSLAQTSEKNASTAQGRIADAATSGSKAASPDGALSHASAKSTTSAKRQPSVVSDTHPSPLRNYSDAAVQAAPAISDLLLQPGQKAPKPRPQRRVITLSMRLLEQRRKDSRMAERRAASTAPSSPATAKSVQGSPASAHKQISLSSPASVDVDTVMSDAPKASAPHGDSPPIGIDTISVNGLVKIRSPELRVQMPPVPAFTASPAAMAASTPISATSTVQSPLSASIVPSPFSSLVVNGVAANPGPVKKKMSLSEYKNKASKAAASRHVP